MRFIKTAIGALAIYLLGSFVAWNFNPSNWSLEGRALAVFGLVILIIVNATVNTVEEPEL